MKMRWGPLVTVFVLHLHQHYQTDIYRVMFEENCEKLFCDVVITKWVFHGKVELVPTNISGEGSEIGAKKAGMNLLDEGEWIWEIRNLCENPRRDLTSKRGSPNPHHKSQGWWLVRVCWALRCTCCWVFKRSPGNSNDPLKVVCRSGDGLNKSHKWNSLFTFGISGAVRWDPKDKVWLWRQQLFSHRWRGPLPSKDMLLRFWK